MLAEVGDNLFAPQVLEDPYSYYGELREHDPVHWNDDYQTWVLTRYADVSWMSRHPEVFSSENAKRDRNPPAPPIPVDDRPYFDKVNEIRSHEFIQSDPPDHTRMRSPLVHPFAPRAIEAWRGLVRDTVDGLIDRVSHRRSMDVRADLAIPLPVPIIAAMLGVPADDRSFMKAMAEKRASSHRTLGAGRMRTSVEGFERTNAYLGHAIDARHAAPTADILSLLATAEKEGVYSREEALANAQSLIDAGHGTTIELLCNGLLALLRNPDQWDLLKGDPAGLAESAVEECLRMDPPVLTLRRIVAADSDFQGRTLVAGQRAIGVIAAANRDPRQVAAPDEFDIRRDPNRHLSFGSGIHYCLGQYLARVEGQEVLKAVADRLPGLRLATDTVAYLPNPRNRSLAALPVAW
jgi:cytochrome P450